MSKKLNRTLSFVLMLVITWSISHAQVMEQWKKDLSGNLLWQQVTSFGNYFVCTNTEFAAYNPETGEQLWANQKFANVAYHQIEEMSGSPLISINQDGNISLLDPFSGEVKFNSTQAGIAEIKAKQVLYQANGILIAGKTIEGKPKMLMIDMTTGKTVWQIEEKFSRILTLNELSNEELLIVSLFKAYKINSKSGEIIWKNSISKGVDQLEGMGKFGNLLQGVIEHVAAYEDFVIYFYQHPSKNLFIIGIEKKNERQSIDGETTISYENNYTAFNITDGSRLWNEPINMKGQLGDMAFYRNGIIILPNDGGRTKINFFDLETAIGLWGKKGRGIYNKGGIYFHLETEKGILLMSQSGEKNYLNFLDPAQGLITFGKPVRINGEVVGTIESEKGILFITTKEINILNPATGELVFEKSIPTNPSLIEQKENTIYAFDTKANIVKMIDINTALVKNVTNIELKFEGKESPNKLELRDKGIFISSEQNVTLYDYTGTQIFQKYYEAPRESGLKRALLYAQAAHATLISINSFYASAELQSAAPDVRLEDAVRGAIVEGLGIAYEELGVAASDFARQSFQQANGRLKATAEGRDFIIIFGKIEKDNALFKVNKDTGEVDGSINLGSEKDPKYAVDVVTGQIIKKTSETQITSYKF